MEKSYSTGEIIVRKGEISPFFYMIKNGKVRVEDKREIYYLSQSDFFGEEGIFLRKPASYTAVASDETMVEMLREDDIDQLVSVRKDTGIRMLRKSIAKAYEHSEIFDEKNRLYLLLLETLLVNIDSSEKGDMIQIPVSLMTIAEQVGISIPSLRMIISHAQSMGDLKLSEDSLIFSRDSMYLKKRIRDITIKRNFSSVFGLSKGIGQYNLLHLLTTEDEQGDK